MKPFISAKRNASAGFTLLEVIAVVVIIGILAAIAAPSWLQYINNQRVGAVTNDLVQSIKTAQQDAIQQRQAVKVTVRTASTTPSINVDSTVTTAVGVAGDGTNIALAEGSNIRPGLVTLQPPVVNGTPQTLIFDYLGMVDRQNTLPYVIKVSTVSNPNKKQCVIVATLLGTVKTARDAACDNPVLN